MCNLRKTDEIAQKDNLFIKVISINDIMIDSISEWRYDIFLFNLVFI